MLLLMLLIQQHSISQLGNGSMVRLKPGVDLDSVHGKMFFAIAMADRVWEQLGFNECWITAAHEAGHHTNPDVTRQFHLLPDGTCQAVDARTHQFNTQQKHEARRILASILGKDYDVILELEGQPLEHIHMQYDPKRPGTVI